MKSPLPRLLPAARLCCLLLLLAAIPAKAAPPEQIEDAFTATDVRENSYAELPDPKDRGQKLIVTRDNFAPYKDLFLSPVGAWLADNLFSLRVFRALDFPWLLGASFEAHSRENVGRFEIGADGSFLAKSGAPAWEGLPFGRAADIDLEEDSKLKAYKVLWNVNAMEAAAASILYDIRMSWFGVQAQLRQSDGIFYRRSFIAQYAAPGAPPAAASPAEVGALPAASPAPSAAGPVQSPIIRQELLQLMSPPVVFGFAQISQRFADAREDDGWIYSPVIGRSRRVLSANRSDGLLGGQLTLDDIFVWSTKVQAVDAQVVAEKKMFLPFPALSTYLAETEDAAALSSLFLAGESEGKTTGKGEKDGEKLLTVHGYYQEESSGRTTVLWNAVTKQYLSQPSWVPTSVVFVPRSVWILELTPREPLYSSGREILVVDKESMLPCYKLAYSPAGELQRVVLGGWALAANKDGSVRFPFAAFVLAVDAARREAVAITTRNVYLAADQNARTAQRLNALLDISAHGAKGAAKDDDAPNEPGQPTAPPDTSVPKPPVDSGLSPED